MCWGLHMCVHMEVRGQCLPLFLSILFILRKHFFLFCFVFPGAHLFSKTSYSASSKDPAASTSPALGLQERTTTSGFLGMCLGATHRA